MALTYNNLFGPSTGDLAEVDLGTAGTPTVTPTGAPRAGAHALVLDPGDRIQFSAYEVARVDANHIIGFRFKTSTTSPTAGGDFFWMVGATDASFNLEMTTAGDLQIEADGSSTVGTVTTPFTAGVWHAIKIYIENTNTGAIEIEIDGSSAFTDASADYLGAAIWDEVLFRNSGTDVIYSIADFYIASGATSIADGLDTPGITTYQKTDGTATDQGDTLGTGTWALASETPGDATSGNQAIYTASTASGEMVTNSGTRAGPSGDSAVGTIECAKFIANLSRGGGGATSHFWRYGNSADTLQEDSVTLGTGNATFVSVSQSATLVPTASEYFQMGGRVDGGQDLQMNDLWGAILHELVVPPAADFPQSTLSQLGVGI